MSPQRFGSAELAGSWPLGSDEWHAARQRRIGGSEISAVLGLSPYESRFSLWHRKVGTLGQVDESPEMEWGKRLEPVIIAKYADQRGATKMRGALTLDVVGEMDAPSPCVVYEVGSWVSTFRPFAIANPDALEWDGERWRIVETKFSMWGDGFGEQGTDQVPINYRQQVLWYMGVFSISQAVIAVLVGGCDYREYVIDFDADEFAQLLDAAQQFLADVDCDREPDIDDHSATYSALREMHPDIVPEDVELTDETAAAFVIAQAALKQAKAGEQFARSCVADEMGNSKRATWAGYTIASRQARGDGVPYVVAGRKLPAVDEMLPSSGFNTDAEFGYTNEENATA